MPTIIDSLLVKLSLDGGSFNKGKANVKAGLTDLKKEAGAGQKSLTEMGDKGAKSFDHIAAAAARFLAIIGGTVAIKNFITDQISANAALDRLSRNLGMQASTISAWEQGVEKAGGSVAGLQGTMDMLSQSQTELQLTGQSGLLPYFAALSVGLADIHGKALPVDEVLLSLADRFSGISRTTANNIGRMMGLDQGTMMLLLKGRKEVELVIARQKEYTAVTKEQAETASRLREQWIENRQSLEDLGRELLQKATPAIEGFLRIMKDVIEWLRNNQQFVETFLTVLAAGLTGLGIATIPIHGTATAILALAAAIAALWDDYQTFKQGGDSLIDWAKWEPEIQAAGRGIDWMKEKILSLTKTVFEAGQAMWKMINPGSEPPAPSGGISPGSPTSPIQPGIGSQGSGLPAPSSQSGALKGKTPEQEALAYFKGQGWGDAQAAGIVANLMKESRMDPGAIGDGGKAYGVAQWHPNRQRDFRETFGKMIQGSSLSDQLAFVQHELTNKERSAGRKLAATTNAFDAAATVSRYYERPADKEGQAAARGAYALQLMQGLNKPERVGMAAEGSGGNSPVNVTNTIGDIHISTQATDAQGVASSIKNALDQSLSTQANTGLR